MKQLTISIGIAAFNEDKTLCSLILSLTGLKSKWGVIKEIIISSDGSTDNTVKKARQIKDGRVFVIENKDRKGIARGLNQIIKHASGDILITLDADITIKDPQFLDKLIEPIVKKTADLTSCHIKEFQPTNIISKALYVSMRIKTNIFVLLNNGGNIYTCHGLVRAFSKKFYKSLHFPTSIGNDMYSYLACIANNYSYAFVPTTEVWYQLPLTLKDHIRQSHRFFSSPSKVSQQLDRSFVKKQTHIPFSIYINALYTSMPLIINNFGLLTMYLLIELYIKLTSYLSRQKETWNIATSTKLMTTDL